MKPKHKKVPLFLKKGLFSNLSSFTDLENRISNLPSTERGDAFEVFAEAYFKTQKRHQAKEVWPDNGLPQSIRNKLGLPPTDMGIDGIFKTYNGKFHAYQVKYRTKRTSLNWDELSTFMGLSDKSDERVLFTNSNDLSSVMNTRTNFYSIKGNDLDKLTKSDFLTIENWLKSGLIEHTRKSPWPHQLEAIDNIVQELKVNDRTTAIMACATGKTLVALWVAEKKDAQTILVLLPSLALVRQTLDDWTKENSWDKSNYLCVCSDSTVVKGVDEIILHQHDLDFTVTTQKEVVEKFIQNQNYSRKIIFSTYQSSQIVAQAMPKKIFFDLAIFDEAHKTASRQGSNYSFALQDKNLPIKKRLFLTATPRHYNVNKKDKKGNTKLVYSMDDQKTYGKVAYKLSFKEAVQQGIICNYKVIISTITSEMINRKLLRQGEIIVAGDVIKAQRIANILAIQSAVDKFEIKRIFSFHNSVKSAKSFTTNSNEGVGAYLKNFTTLHVNGNMSTSSRKSLLEEFKEADNAIISNARCLTEGVNLPTVDMVAFLSPKKSKVDIVQATGRAMRTSPNKTCGYILIPIFLEQANGETIEQALEKTKFDTIGDVLQAMQEQDKNLAEIINQMREDRGRTGGFDDSRLREKVECIGPEFLLPTLRDVIAVQIVEKLGSNWDENFGELLKFKEKNGNCNVPQNYPSNHSLGTWVNTQRQAYKNNKLSLEQINRLNSIGFDWDPINTYWEKMFSELLIFKKLTGHCNVPCHSSENTSLGIWVGTQRNAYKNNKLSLEQINKLNSIGFDWDPINTYQKKMFNKLLIFKKLTGHCNVPQIYNDNPSLGIWVTNQRSAYKNKKLPLEQINRLNSINFDWDPINTYQKKMFNELLIFKKLTGHCNVPCNYYDNPQLSIWVVTRRQAYKNNKLSLEQINRLNSINFDWDPINTSWQNRFDQLVRFKELHGHCNVPKSYSINPSLGIWVGTQRKKYINKKLSLGQTNRLNSIGFDWDPINTSWQNRLDQLVQFKELHGHCNVPRSYTNKPKLGSWVSKQRCAYKNKKLSPNRINKLNTIGFDWNPKK